MTSLVTYYIGLITSSLILSWFLKRTILLFLNDMQSCIMTPPSLLLHTILSNSPFFKTFSSLRMTCWTLKIRLILLDSPRPIRKISNPSLPTQTHSWHLLRSRSPIQLKSELFMAISTAICVRLASNQENWFSVKDVSILIIFNAFLTIVSNRIWTVMIPGSVRTVSRKEQLTPLILLFLIYWMLLAALIRTTTTTFSDHVFWSAERKAWDSSICAKLCCILWITSLCTLWIWTNSSSKVYPIYST